MMMMMMTPSTVSYVAKIELVDTDCPEIHRDPQGRQAGTMVHHISQIWSPTTQIFEKEKQTS